MVSCNLCNSFGRAKIQYNHDLAREHAETHFLQLKFIDGGVSGNQIFHECFPNFAAANSRNGLDNSGRQNIIALCHSLFDANSKTKSPTRIICEKCDEEIKIADPWKPLTTNVLIEHACYHLRLDLYDCDHCDREFRTRSCLSMHLNKTHRLRTMIGHFRDKSDDFVEEISSMIKACFGEWKANRQRSKGATSMSSIASDPKVRRGRTEQSHLAIERQSVLNRLVRKTADRNGNVRCRLCSKGIKAVKEHAYRHLTTPLYRCRECSDSFFGSTDMKGHLKTDHALPSLTKNYECLGDQYHREILAIFNKCYGKEMETAKKTSYRNLNESKICKKTTRSKLTVRRHLLCYRLIRKCVDAERLVQCRLCSKRISAKLGNTLTSDRVIQHALLHLNKAMYHCKKCPRSFITRFGVCNHLKTEHALSTNPHAYYQCSADQFHDEYVRILRQCYEIDRNEEDDQLVEAPSTSAKLESTESRPSVIASKLTIERQTLCNQLTRECSDQKNQRLQCRLCSKWISVQRLGNTCSSNVMLHVFVHLAKPIYRCKICADTFVTRNNVSQHLRTKHALPALKNFVCLADQFHAEIVEMLHKCCNKGTASEAKPVKSRIRAEANVRGGVNGSKQTAERQLFCYRLIRKNVQSDGKIECRLCKNRITVKNHREDYQSSSAMMHVQIHLKKPIYRCLICSETRPYLNSIKHHLRKTHSLTSANNYESLADKYHSDILAMLSQCYGEL